jgi:hypothetical protein
MNVDIERVAITLQGVPLALGDQVAERLDEALKRRLSELKLRGAGTGLARADLGVIDASSSMDASEMTDLIAARLAEWVRGRHDETAPDATRED